MLSSSQENNVVVFPASFVPQRRVLQQPANEAEPIKELFIEGIDKPEPMLVNGTGNSRYRIANAAPQQQPVPRTRKAPEAGFRLMETPDATLATVMAAKTTRAGLANGENVILICPEAPEKVIQRLSMTGLDVESAIDFGKLVLLSSVPAISSDIGISTNYRELFGELFLLADMPADRVIMLGMDLVVNLESQYQAQASISKFTQAADEMGCKFIAQYTRNNSIEHDRLDAACSSLVNCYFAMSRAATGNRYMLQVKNLLC
jgi:KaiC/GvpD/RAD55 family RecA-like ATPase